jgi:hypothetical protein
MIIHSYLDAKVDNQFQLRNRSLKNLQFFNTSDLRSKIIRFESRVLSIPQDLSSTVNSRMMQFQRVALLGLELILLPIFRF